MSSATSSSLLSVIIYSVHSDLLTALLNKPHKNNQMYGCVVYFVTLKYKCPEYIPHCYAHYRRYTLY